jgi:hypothetical protein
MAVAHWFLPRVECGVAVPVPYCTRSDAKIGCGVWMWNQSARGAKRSTVKDLQELLKRKDLRSADRANMGTILKRLQAGGTLSYQERVNLHAYVQRYGMRTGAGE